MKQIPLKGNPNILFEKESRSNEELAIDCERGTTIVYPDLVFTLRQNPQAYWRPSAKIENGKLYAISNLTFLRATKKAGLEKIGFNLLINKTIPLERLLEDFNLELDFGEAKRSDFLKRYLFFMQLPVIPYQNYPRIRLHPENNNSDFRNIQCIGYDLLMTGTYKDRVLNERYFIKAMVAHNGLLRSHDGIKKRSKTLREYFSWT